MYRRLAALSGLLLLPSAARASEGMPQLDFGNPLIISQVVWLAIIFLGLYLLLARWALPQVSSVLATRETAIRSDLDAAHAAQARANEAVRELTEATARARSEAQSSINQASDEAKRQAAEQAATLNAKLDEQLRAAETRIGEARASAMSALRDVASGRRLIPWSQLEAKGGKRRHLNDSDNATQVTPIRFVGACEKGHIQDINWSGAVHGDAPNCGGAIWLEEQGTSGDPRDVTVACTCGRSVSLVEISAPGRLGQCAGRQPWLDADAVEGCANKLRLLIRTATNTYFSQVATVISLPQADDTLSRLVQSHLSDLREAESAAEIRTLRKVGSLKAAFEGHTDENVFAALQQLLQTASADGAAPVKIAEFDRLASGDALIGRNEAGSLLFAETLPGSSWRRAAAPEHDVIEAVVAVHRLREVSCLYGFTRFEAAPNTTDGELEDVGLAVDGAPIARAAEWLPAVEQFGEGVFLKFDADIIGGWLVTAAVKEVSRAWLEAHEGAWRGKPTEAPPSPGAAYVLLHSLSHALLTEIALYCGYPASSLKERVYAVPAQKGQAPARCGLLIYTASAGAQGSLGGLAAMSSKTPMLLERV